MSTIIRHQAGSVVAGQKTGGQFKEHLRAPAAPPVPVSENPLAREFGTVEEKIEAMTRELDTLVAGLETDEGWNQYLDTMARFHTYSFSNQMLIAFQAPDATLVAGKTKWAELGRELKPYEERGRGIAIFRPKLGYFEKTDAQGNIVRDENGKPVKERKVFGYTTATVYDISQTSGSDLPDGVPLLREEPPAGLIEDLESTITSLGYPVTYGRLSPGMRGATGVDQLTGEKRVIISEDLPEGHRAKTLAHELGHIAAGHTDRLEEYHVREGGARGHMEIEAESISHVILRLNGMDPSESTSRYAAGWAKVQSDDPDAVKNSAVAVQKAVKELIGSRPWANVPESGPQERKPYVRKPRKSRTLRAGARLRKGEK